MKRKELDIFNFFYSIGAVVILIGVIAKFMEWKLQDELLLSGLGVEILVFTMSSIQFKREEKKYNWERLFPELVDNASAPSSLQGIQKSVEELAGRYYKGMNEYVERFESLNTDMIKGSGQYQESLNSISLHLAESAHAFSAFKDNVSMVTASFVELHAISTDIHELQLNLQKMAAISIISGDKLNQFQEQMDALNDAIYRFNALSSGIIHQFKQIGD
jgi:gliding motility-associated protein GldL